MDRVTPLDTAPGSRLARAAAGLFLLVAAAAGAGHPNHWPEARTYLADPHYAVMAVSILQIANVGATNEFPPDGVMRVEAKLRGGLRPNAAYNFRLEPPRRPRDYELQDGNLTRLKPDWYRRPLQGPKEGTRIIVFAYVPDNPLKRERVVVLHGPWLDDTPENRAAALAAMTPRDRAPWLQRSILALISAILLILMAPRLAAGHRDSPSLE
ncbi:MAG: hypothetical protein ACOZDY_20380 [Pseudomonadota bacterium]